MNVNYCKWLKSRILKWQSIIQECDNKHIKEGINSLSDQPTSLTNEFVKVNNCWIGIGHLRDFWLHES